MLHRGYLLNFDKVHELKCNYHGETHVVIYSTERTKELFL